MDEVGVDGHDSRVGRHLSATYMCLCALVLYTAYPYQNLCASTKGLEKPFDGPAHGLILQTTPV
jgi:hypothetical protein